MTKTIDLRLIQLTDTTSSHRGYRPGTRRSAQPQLNKRERDWQRKHGGKQHPAPVKTYLAAGCSKSWVKRSAVLNNPNLRTAGADVIWTSV
jgi:hypothetical protein